MQSPERVSQLTVKVGEKSPYKVSVSVDGRDRSIGIQNGELLSNVPEPSLDLMRTLMIAHLIAPLFPETIETNFPVEWKEILDEMYRHYDFPPLQIIAGDDRVTQSEKSETEQLEKIDVANAHSGGLDSAYRLTKLLSDDQNPMIVHLRNLNKKANAKEAEASKIQAETWGVPYQEVTLVNSSMNNGPDTMRTRDLLLATIAAVTSYRFRPDFVEVEGGWLSDQSAHFSEQTSSFELLNRLMKESGIDVAIRGVDPGDVETVGELIRLEKELGLPILDLVQNCFSDPYQQLPNIRRRWEREAPQIARASSERWCGSCYKCRRMTLGRLFYGDPKFDGVSREEVEFFKRDTEKWIKNYPQHNDMISASFYTHLNGLAR